MLAVSRNLNANSVNGIHALCCVAVFTAILRYIVCKWFIISRNVLLYIKFISDAFTFRWKYLKPLCGLLDPKVRCYTQCNCKAQLVANEALTKNSALISVRLPSTPAITVPLQHWRNT